MLTENTLVVLVIAGLLGLLAILMLFRAIQHDRAVAAAGPIEELAAYDRRLEEKQRLIDDLEEDLQKRREAMAAMADLQAEVDGLRRQKEELLTEWESLQERREAVLEVRKEIEDAIIERQGLEAELVPLRAEYLEKKERLEQADGLIARIDELEAKERAIVAKIEDQADTLAKLETAKTEIDRLNERATDLQSENARLEGQVASSEAQHSELAARIAKQQEVVAEEQTELGLVAARVAAAALEEQKLKEARGALEARLAHLQAEIAKREGHTVGGEAIETDALRELKEKPPVVVEMLSWPPAERENEQEALKRVERRLRAKALEYPSRTLRAFHTAMKVNETTQMAVLAGISGTGKSQLPRQYAAGMGIGFLQVPVQPRWDSPQDLMGFYNYIEGRFRPTDMARALWSLDEINNEDADLDRMMMILLDEMNLARVEYYFSDFLSRLESRPKPSEVDDANERKDAEIELEIPNMAQPPRIFPGYNLLFAGTMNEDESTQSLSDKVVDRANIIRFAAPKSIKDGVSEGNTEPPRALSQSSWQNWTGRSLSRSDETAARGHLDSMVEIMRELGRPFGHRLGRAILAYAANYPEIEGGGGLRDALSDQVEMRLLPKLRGVELDVAAPQFERLQSLVEREFGDDALAQAISDSVVSSEATGQFVWSGVTR